jgi:hypothetical protein
MTSANFMPKTGVTNILKKIDVMCICMPEGSTIQVGGQSFRTLVNALVNKKDLRSDGKILYKGRYLESYK